MTPPEKIYKTVIQIEVLSPCEVWGLNNLNNLQHEISMGNYAAKIKKVSEHIVKPEDVAKELLSINKSVRFFIDPPQKEHEYSSQW
jgi:hypothetical protein